MKKILCTKKKAISLNTSFKKKMLQMNDNMKKTTNALKKENTKENDNFLYQTHYIG